GNVAPFLLTYLGDQDADVRAAAAWALSMSDSTNDIGPQLTDALKQETDPVVRTRMYQALGAQPGADPEIILPLVHNESDPTARLAGLTYLAGAVRSSSAPDVTDFFNQTAIPELTHVALQSNSSQNRLGAVIALERAGTTAATSALQQIAQQSTDPKVVSSVQLTLSNPSRH
ncbi:MAG TPA: HEAT repeat domain-containing protein, partial [Nitrospiria bacterium]|nr:HEAT repeat domain-containing protein [Nitrospiria bacterium]